MGSFTAAPSSEVKYVVACLFCLFLAAGIENYSGRVVITSGDTLTEQFSALDSHVSAAVAEI